MQLQSYSWAMIVFCPFSYHALKKSRPSGHLTEHQHAPLFCSKKLLYPSNATTARENYRHGGGGWGGKSLVWTGNKEKKVCCLFFVYKSLLLNYGLLIKIQCYSILISRSLQTAGHCELSLLQKHPGAVSSTKTAHSKQEENREGARRSQETSWRILIHVSQSVFCRVEETL